MFSTVPFDYPCGGAALEVRGNTDVAPPFTSDQMMHINYHVGYEPKRIVTIVCPSRSGSTVFKHALCLHPDLCSLAGEEEPYYKFTHNGYPAHSSDEFHEPNHPELIRLLIANELYNYQSAYNRSWLQTSGLEEPPFVEAIHCHPTDTLVLKTPQNCYRRGVLEHIYPNAEIIPITVLRDPRAVVNGLLDGWESGQFTARLTPRGWWCFDMPPGWSWERSVLQRCLHQYQTATRYVKRDYTDAIDVTFEHFIENWITSIKRIWLALGLKHFEPRESSLPLLSITEPPQPERWRTKRPWLEDLEW